MNLIKLFEVNLLTLFYMIHFILNIYGIAVKRPSLQKRVSKFMPKKFYEINPLELISFNFLA
jgi:hypothetical protein